MSCSKTFPDCEKNCFSNLSELVKKSFLSPSTTAVHATSIPPGPTAAEHGIYEWEYYEPEVDGIFLPFRFSLARQEDREISIDLSKIFPFDSIYKQLMQIGVRSYIFTEKISVLLLIFNNELDCRVSG